MTPDVAAAPSERGGGRASRDSKLRAELAHRHRYAKQHETADDRRSPRSNKRVPDSELLDGNTRIRPSPRPRAWS